MKKPGAKAIIGYKGKLLLVLRDNNPNIPSPNMYNAPGGGIDKNENSTQAIMRELREEINLDATNLIPTGITTYSDGSIVYRYFVPITDQQFNSLKLISEGQRLDWFTVEEALDLIKQKRISYYLYVYLSQFQSEIKRFLNGDRDFERKDEILQL